MMNDSTKIITLADDVLINQIEAGKILGIPHATLQKWRSTGENNIPFVKLGRNVRYRTADLKLWIEANTHNKMGANS